jgi:hypothetical protein
MFARWLRIGLAAVSLTALPAFAYADGSTTQPAPKEHVREGKSKAQFPMSAADFKARIDARITKTREKIVAHMQAKNVAAEKQEKVLAKFDDGTVTIMAEVDKVCADGTVTKEEAQQVREVAQQVRGHHKGHKEGKGKEASTAAAHMG